MKKYICENPRCGKEHDGSYGSGRFCSKHCRMVYIGIKSNETMKKNGNKPNNIANAKREKSPYGTWRCKRCNLIFRTRRELNNHRHDFHPIEQGSSWNKGLTKETSPIIKAHCEKLKELYRTGKLIPSNKVHHMSEEQKKRTSESCKKFYREHPDLVPYKLHHSSKESYPEKYFRELLTNEDITNFEQEYPFLGYSLDFGFIDKKIDLEIDGSQHWLDKRIIEHDKERTENIEKNGWSIIRIRWDEWQTKTDTEKKEWINNLKSLVMPSDVPAVHVSL